MGAKAKLNKRERRKSGRRRGQQTPDRTADEPALRGEPAPLWLRLVLPVVVAVGAFLPFLPALEAGFVNWDDDKVILGNVHIRGLTSANVDWMFTETKMGHYHPLTWLSYAVDFAISQARYPELGEAAQARYNTGFDPRIVHFNNMLIHAACAVMVYFFALLLLRVVLPRRTEGRDVGAPVAAAIAALLFAVHPLRVESVAWVTERRDVLSGVFFVGCLACYLRYAVERQRMGVKIGWYAAAVVALLLSLFSKAWGITVPAVLAVMDVYPLRRIGGRSGWFSEKAVKAYLDKIPFAILAIIFAVQAKAAQGSQLDTLKSLKEWGIGDRIAQAIYGLFFYSYKTVVPTNLTPLVPLPVHNNPWAARYVVAGAVVLVIAVAVVLLWKRWPAGLALAVCYVAVLSPVLGVAQSGPQLVADKYSYLGCLVWPVLAGGALLWLWRRRREAGWARVAAPAAGGVAVVVCVVLAVMTWGQTRVWHDSWALWNHAVKVDPQCVLCRTNLGMLEREAGHVDEAIRQYQAAYEIDPSDPVLLNNLAVALRQDPKRLDQAIEILRKAVRLSPKFADLHYSLAKALEESGAVDEAEEEFLQAIRWKSGVPKFHRGLGELYYSQRRYGDAAKQYRRALKYDRALDPRSRGVINDLDRLARIAWQQGRQDDAIRFFREILEIDPDNGPALRGIARLEGGGS
jgi:Tfp pilus assembly protein PilF